MSEYQKRTLIQIAGTHLGVDLNVGEPENVDLLNEFLLPSHSSLLCASLSNKQIKFVNNVNNFEERTVLFFKTNSASLTDDNLLQNVNVISLQGSIPSALYHTLNNVFTPLLVNNDNTNNPNIEKQLNNLQAGLKSTILTTDKSLENVDLDSLSVILNIDQELEYWKVLSNSTKSKSERAYAEAFYTILNPLSKEFSVLDALPLTDVEDCLENARNVLDDLWKHEPAYPTARAEHLMDLISSDLCLYIIKQLKSSDVWSEDFNKVSELLEQCLGIGEVWLTNCRELTEIFWPNYSLHIWKKSVYVSDSILKLNDRLRDVLNIRTIHKQIIKLLSNAEQNDLKTDEMFKPLTELNYLQYGSYSDHAWNSAKKQFEFLLQPAEQKVAYKLKKQLTQINANTRQLLHEFGRYSELISRPVLKSILQNERQYLLSLLNDYVKVLSNQSSNAPNYSTKYNTPQVVAEILEARQLEAKATEIQSISSKLLDDLQGYKDFEHQINDLLKELKTLHTDLYDSWTSEVLAHINDKSLSLCESDPVVQFTANKLMKVNYSSRLVSLIAEVRQLAALGYNIPENILQTSTHAKQFMKLAKYLEQIANFHNTIGDRMIPSQRPMMLGSALELSRLIQEQEVVSWENIKSVEVYVNNLKTVVDKLSKENTFLSTQHGQLTARINNLKEISLIKHFDKWKQTTRHMREVMDMIEQKGFKNMNVWKQDLDASLCSVLEKQYNISLSQVHLYMPQIYADLVYRDTKLHFSPNETILREKYQQQLQKFLSIPKTFRGVSDDNSVFEGIITRSTDKLSDVQQNTEKLFEQLHAVQKHWESWLTLDTLDTTKLTKPDHWLLYFKASKTFSQEIAKLPSTEENVGCFLIGLSRLRSDLESHNRSYWDQLVNSLKDSIMHDVITVQEYVDSSTSMLNKKPLTIEQMGEVDSFHSEILKQTPEMDAIYKEMISKSTVLSTWTRERIDSVNRLQTAWERLQNLLENYEIIIAKQVEGIRTTLGVSKENLTKEIERFSAKWEQLTSRPNSGQIASETLMQLYERSVDVKKQKEQWMEIVSKETKLIHDYDKFNINVSPLEISETITKNLDKEESMWSIFDEFYSNFEAIGNEEWLIFRKKQYILEEFLSTWQAKLEETENNALNTRLLQEINNYQAIVPHLKLLKGDDFTDKHWIEIFALLEIREKSLDNIQLKDFLDASNSVMNHLDELKGICKRAASEIIIRQALAELDQWEVQARFQLIPHTDTQGKEVLLIKDFKDILNKIGDNQSLLQSVKNSSDYETFAERFAIWENRLNDLDQNLTLLAQIQRKWVYLEPIFGNGTLGKEKHRFDRLDREFRKILKHIENDARVCSLCKIHNLNVLLTSIGDQLSRCQKSLEEFLAEKRERFPRFLFLGDDDLLEVVGQSTKEQVIQSHLKKLFAGIHSINLDNGNKSIIEIKSLQGEKVKLDNSVALSNTVEDWLSNLVKEMQNTLKTSLIACLKDGKSPDPLKYPSQILCLAESINFTTKCEQAITSMSLQNLLQSYKSQLKYYSSLDMVNDNTNDIDDEDGIVLEIKLKALLLDTIHHISVIENLINANITKLSEWDWQKQLRFYADANGEIIIRMVNAKLEYAYEYIGNPQKLVRTPLTDQCFLTLTQAMHLGMGGNPYGPAGTGKTESVKALGALLGRQVLVFNCDEGIDAASMGRILSGLVRCGAWGCFDEFNRLDEATLSAISMHIQPIQNALKAHRTSINLLGKEIEVNPHCGIFVTLNPAGSGYGGRNKLPDNLKQLFRPVIMTLPDHEQIARTLLHCDSYKYADSIGRKLIEVFTLAEQLLSKQQHYDWGLRALRTVLSGCGRIMRDYAKENIANKELQADDEYTLVVKAIRMNTLSKLTFSDSEIFDQLLGDVFPDITFERLIEDKLHKALEESFNDLKIQKNQRQINKCMELYEQLKQRMGVAIVGPPSSGKSTIRNVLLNALTKIGKTIKQHVFNPKSMPRNQLLGQIDTDTRQWTDGVLTYYSLLVSNEPLDVWSLIVCDGDVDPEWVESLNSVLDDNRLLSLPSGWRVQFGPNVNFIFETHDLSYASPATISRMGIIFLSEEDVSVEDYVDNSMRQLPYEISSVLGPFMNNYLYKALDWVKNEGELVIQTPRISMIRTILSQLKECDNKNQFIVGLLNGLGGQMDADYKTVFADKLFDWVNEIPRTIPSKAHYNYERNIIDTYFTSANQDVNSQNDEMPLIFTAQINQTIDIIRKWLLLDLEAHFLLIGPHGAAKMLILEHVIRERTDFDIATVHCSAHVTPQYIIHKIFQYCIAVNSSKGKIYKPKKGNLALYFKNLHLLKGDNWGTNMLLEFLQQLIVYHGFFDANLEWVVVQNVTIIGTLAAVNHLSMRFTSLMHIYNVDLPQNEDMNIIFTNYLTIILKQCLSSNSLWTKQKMNKLIHSMLGIYNQIKEKFNQISYQHYIFSPHDITNWCKGIFRYKQSPNDAENVLLEIICHEALRIFYDRLVTHEDRELLMNIINQCIAKDWNKANILSTVLDHYYVATSQLNSTRHYTPLTKLNSDDWCTIVTKGIIQYERDGYNMEVEIIPELLTLAANLSRALTVSKGHCLLVGNSGIGRRSALKIISALESAKLIIPHTPSDVQFKNDLKLAMQISGIDGEQVYFLLEDHILSKDNILNIINIFLSSSEVPGLYAPAELETLISGLKEEAGRTNFDGNLYDFFIERVKNKMHVIICMEIQNDAFWQHIENCPALIQNCAVMWMGEWSEASMDKMPHLIIKKFNDCLKSNEMLIEATNGFSLIQNSVNRTYLTPIRYINLIKSYIDIFNEKKTSIITKQKKLKAGVAKLTEARNLVADLKMEAGKQELIIAEKQGHANAALDLISSTMKNVNVQKDEMEQLKKQSELENKELSKRKLAIEQELAEVEPLVQEARKAVGNIKTEALSEIRSLRAPPDIIRDILEGVLRLMGIQDTSWNSMKTFLAKRGVKEDIRAFNASKINVDNRNAVERLIRNKPESFDPKSAKRASIAAAPLAAWVLANVRYSKVIENIKPLEMEQQKLEDNLKMVESQLANLSAGLLSVDEKVKQLKGQLATYTREAAEIEIKLNHAQETLKSAEGLVGKLIDEFDRWEAQLINLENDLKDLPVYCLLAAAFITYLSSEPEDIRSEILTKWINKIVGDNMNFSLEQYLTSEREQLQWQSEGLSTDQLSVQNAIIILKGKMTPFLFDPTSMAINWIKTRYKSKNMETITQNSPKFNTSLELAIRFGKILLIEEVESVSPQLLQVLKQNFIQQGERLLINISGKLIDYHKEFQLILSSRNTNLQLTADVVAHINIINFTTTRAGLTEQLLISAIRQENPQLEEKRKQLLREQEELQEKQHKLQNDLLEDLVNSTGDILLNKHLLASLNETKASSNAISEALKESTEIQNKIRQEYNVYKDISIFASSLYFAAVEFVKSNVLYSLSVSSFTNLFLQSLPSIEALQNTESYTHKLLIQALYQYMGRGIFKNDRLKFLLYIVYKMFPEHIPTNEWNFLIGNIILTTRGDGSLDNRVLGWLPEHCTTLVNLLHLALPNLYNTLGLSDGTLWKNFMQSSQCETQFPPQCKITEFQKVIAVQVLRNDRLYSTICQCVLNLTGIKNLNLDVLHLSQIQKESNCMQPILLLTTSGNDPSNEIRELALNIVNHDKFEEISMGEGQESIAINTLNEAANNGHWLILKNLHLVTSWLPVLCQHLQTIKPQKNFRLWLVTEAHAKFSSVLAENSLKITYEVPIGIKNNLYRIFTSYGFEFIQNMNPTASRIFFVLACVHAILQERRNYIPQGWSKWYEFSDTDLLTMVKLAEDIWNSRENHVQWKYLIGWSSQAVYGGRIENRQDLTILEAYLHQYFTDEVLSHRWKPLNCNQPLPTTSNYQEYLKFISTILSKDMPSYFGLPENVEQAWEKNVSSDILQYLKKIAIAKNVDTQMAKEVYQKNLSPYFSLWKKLNQGHDFIHTNLSPIERTDSLSQFIHTEFQFAINLIQYIHQTLSKLNKIVKGHAIGKENELKIAKSLISYKTPDSWMKMWNGPTEPSKYLRNAIAKTININKLQDNSKYFSTQLDLSLFFNPQTFLSCCKQQYSRRLKIPLDELIIQTQWKTMNDAIILSGLLIEGALFDGINLLPCSDNSDSVNSIPNCFITWEHKNKIMSDDNCIEIPLYYTSDRDKILTNLQVPCSFKEKHKWIEAGVAFFLS